MTSEPTRLKNYLIRLLGRREYSRAELEHKALCHAAGFAPDTVHAVLDDLQALGLQDDARFAESFIRSKAQQGQGLRKIQSALQQKGIAPELWQTCLQTLREEQNLNFAQSALALYQRKYKTPAATPQERAKRMRFLASRGFDFSVIQSVIKHDQ